MWVAEGSEFICYIFQSFTQNFEGMGGWWGWMVGVGKILLNV